MKVGKFVFLGLDGGTWTLIDKYLDEGLMPNLQRVVKQGVRGTLLSSFPFTSRTAWISMLTGANPGKHGIPHHIIGGRSELPSIWQILSSEGFELIVANDVITYPPHKLNGVMISGGFSTPPDSKRYVYPDTLFEEINSVANGYIPNLSSQDLLTIKNGLYDDFYTIIQEQSTKVMAVALHLARKRNWDMLAVTLDSTDTLHHFYWGKHDYLKRFYQWLDTAIGDLANITDEQKANFIIVSDHGFGPINKHFLVNTWLAEEGFASVQEIGKTRSFLASKNIDRALIRKKLDKLHLRNVASKLAPKSIKKVVPIEEGESGFLDLENSVAYSEAYNEIRIIDENAESYEDTKSKIIERLLKLSDNGTNVVAEAHKREEVFWGPYTDRAHDVIFLLNYGYCYSPAIRKDALLSTDMLEGRRTGDHRPEGILIAYGSDIKEGSTLNSPTRIWDVAPTILHMMKMNLMEYMDGKVIKEIFRPESEPAEKSVLYEKGSVQSKIENDESDIYTEEEEKEIERHLRDLGYMGSSEDSGKE